MALILLTVQQGLCAIIDASCWTSELKHDTQNNTYMIQAHKPNETVTTGLNHHTIFFWKLFPNIGS